MTSYRVQALCNGVTIEATAATASPIGLAPNPTREISVTEPTITSPDPLPDATKNSAYTATLNVTGGVGPFTWALASGTLPTGLSLSSGGVISGTPTVLQTPTFTISVTDSTGRTDTKSFSLAVVAAAVPNYGPHMGDWMVQAGDQELVVPDGTYDGGNINAAGSVHASTAGTYGGWLVLRADNKGGAVIDLATTGFNLGPQGGTNRNYRILFIGFSFVNGDVALWNSNRVRFWHCSFTFPITEWNSQYAAAGGSAPTYSSTAINAMANPNCRAIGSVGELSVGSPYNNYIGAYGCDFDNIGNDAIYAQNTNNLEVIGCRFRKVYHYASSIHGSGGTSTTLFHSDCIQHEGGATATITDNFVGGDLQFECHDGSISGLTFSNNWQAGSPGVGFTLDKMSSAFSSCTVSGNRWWGNGQYQNGSNAYTASPQYDSGYDLFVFNPSTGNSTPPTGVTVSSTTHAAPSGVTVTANLIADLPNQTTAWGHASNPAVVWQAAHAYSSWAAYFSGNWP